MSTSFSFLAVAFAARFAEDQPVVALMTLSLGELVSFLERRLWASLMLWKVRMGSVVEKKVVSQRFDEHWIESRRRWGNQKVEGLTL